MDWLFTLVMAIVFIVLVGVYPFSPLASILSIIVFILALLIGWWRVRVHFKKIKRAIPSDMDHIIQKEELARKAAGVVRNIRDIERVKKLYNIEKGGIYMKHDNQNKEVEEVHQVEEVPEIQVEEPDSSNIERGDITGQGRSITNPTEYLEPEGAVEGSSDSVGEPTIQTSKRDRSVRKIKQDSGKIERDSKDDWPDFS